MADPAGWYPDPTTRHELRYWDGYAWLDNVSDQGAASTDPLGGKPMPAPSEAAAKASAPAPAAAKSKTPMFIAIGAAVVVLLAAIGFFATRKSGGGGGEKATQLGTEAVAFNDDVKDAVHPVIHLVHIKANTAVFITGKTDDKDTEPGIVVLTSQATVDAVDNKIQGAKDLLNNSLKDACSNLREEDIGAKGTVVYRADKSQTAGDDLHTFMVVPVEGDYEFVPVLVDQNGQCKAGKSSVNIVPKFVDFSPVQNITDLESVINADSGIQSELSAESQSTS